jgi:hypothetical protein
MRAGNLSRKVKTWSTAARFDACNRSLMEVADDEARGSVRGSQAPPARDRRCSSAEFCP